MGPWVVLGVCFLTKRFPVLSVYFFLCVCLFVLIAHPFFSLALSSSVPLQSLIWQNNICLFWSGARELTLNLLLYFTMGK